jgi:hypothetical protein
MRRYVLEAHAPHRVQVLAELHAILDNLPEGKAWRVEVRELRRERSDEQNAALWGVAYPPLCEATGYRPDELHEAFCRRFFGTVEREILGQVITQACRSTTRNAHSRREVIDRAQFSQFYAMVQQVGAELGIEVPDPLPCPQAREA